MLTLDDQCVVMGEVPVEHDLLARSKFEEYIDDVKVFVDIEDPIGSNTINA